MEDENSVGYGGAPHACASCKKNKRRCDKNLPSCSLCLKTGRFCNYLGSPPPSHIDEISNLQRRVRELEEHILHRSTETPCTVPIAGRLSCQNSSLAHLPQSLLHVQASYLDSDILSAWNPPAQSIHEPAPEEIVKVLGSRSDIDLIKARYFQSVHVWMPIISKIRLDRLTDRSLGTIRADIALLYLCMKLVQEVPPPQQEGQSELYIIAKQFLNDLHMKGPLTLRIVQAGLLLSIYELGHAIFPSAFMTIGHCARGGIAMGLHNRLAPQLAGKPRSWADWEERLRVWWMIVILDRYVTVGADYRPLCTEDPNKDTLLPADDSAWDNGEMVPPERVSLSSEQGTVSPFARLAQAANLLGRVIRHCSETKLELHFVLDNFETLDQTILSLTELLAAEQSAESMETCIAATICFSALFKLYNHHSCDLFYEDSSSFQVNASAAPRVRQCMQRSLDMIRETCLRVLSFVQEFRPRLTHPTMERVSPLMLHSIYNCATSLSWLFVETNNSQYLTGRRICEDTLRSLGLRWKAAGTYLELLRIADMAENESG